MATVLIVEDNRANMKLMADIARSKGHEVVEAFDAETGLQQVRSCLPDVIVMDIQLPGIDGLSAVSRIRADVAVAHIPVMVVTARGMPGDEDKILAVGCDAYLLKPIDYRAFLTTIERLTEGEMR